tara:strand:- start:196 stop:306 length:111 start_codon:yes stop_codon:yes gene_type:complete
MALPSSLRPTIAEPAIRIAVEQAKMGPSKKSVSEAG